MKVFKQVKELVEGRGGTIFSYTRTTREIVHDVGRPELQPRMGRCLGRRRKAAEGGPGAAVRACRNTSQKLFYSKITSAPC